MRGGNQERKKGGHSPEELEFGYLVESAEGRTLTSRIKNNKKFILRPPTSCARGWEPGLMSGEAEANV